MPYYVYVLLCRDGSFYTGYTKNLDARIKLHMNGNGARYTKIHKPKKLFYSEMLASRAEAMKRERKLKALSHAQKKALVKPKHRNRQREQ